MEQIKISQLPELVQQIQNANFIPVVHAGETWKWSPFTYLVKNSGNETIAGVKTFSSSPIVPVATGSTQAVQKSQLDAVEQKNIPPTLSGRLTEPTGDGMADVPDNPAGVTYLPNFATTDSWTATNGTVTVANNILKCTATADGMVLIRAISWGQRLMTFRVRPSKSMTLAVFGTDGTQAIGTTATLIPGIWNQISFYNTNATSTNIRFAPNGTETAGDFIEISQEGTYIGTGAYLSRIPDRSGNRGPQSFGVLPFQGKYGRGLRFLGAHYGQYDTPVIGTVGTILVKARFNSTTPATLGLLYGNRNSSNLQGLILAQTATNGAIVLGLADGSTSQSITISATTPNTTDIQDIIIRILSASSIQYKFNNGSWVTVAVTVGSFLSITSMILGRRASGVDYFNGDLHAMGMTSDILTDAEVEAWRNDPVGFGVDSPETMATRLNSTGLVDATFFGGNPLNEFVFGANDLAITGTTDVDAITKTGFYSAGSSATGLPVVAAGSLIHIAWGSDSSAAFQIYRSMSGTHFYNRAKISSVWGSWTKIMHEGNDGADSGFITDRAVFATKTGTGTGTQGQIAFDASYLYCCTATNTWKRVALTSF